MVRFTNVCSCDMKRCVFFSTSSNLALSRLEHRCQHFIMNSISSIATCPSIFFYQDCATMLSCFTPFLSNLRPGHTKHTRLAMHRTTHTKNNNSSSSSSKAQANKKMQNDVKQDTRKEVARHEKRRKGSSKQNLVHMSGKWRHDTFMSSRE